MKQLFSVVDEVEKFLTKHPVLRDDDRRLIVNLWTKRMGGSDVVDHLEPNEILKIIASPEMPSPESITRCRRKLQEKHPMLRGEIWYKRHQRAENIRKGISAL